MSSSVVWASRPKDRPTIDWDQGTSSPAAHPSRLSEAVAMHFETGEREPGTYGSVSMLTPARMLTVLSLSQDTPMPIFVKGKASPVAAELGFQQIEALLQQLVEITRCALEPVTRQFVLDPSDISIYTATPIAAPGTNETSAGFYMFCPARASASAVPTEHAIEQENLRDLAIRFAEQMSAVEAPTLDIPQASDNPAQDLYRWSGLPVKELASLAGVSERRFYDWLSGDTVSRVHRDRLLRLRALTALLASMLSRDEVATWFNTPLRSYSARSPAEIWKAGEEQTLRDIVERYLHSVAT